MPCLCGRKVERHQSKVQCIVCKDIMHSSCYKIKSVDIELVKGAFKCQPCLSSRRASSCSTPICLTRPSTIVSEVPVDVSPLVKVVSNESTCIKLVSEKVPVTSAHVSSNAANVSSIPDYERLIGAQMKSAAVIDMVYKEIIAQKQQQEALNDVVSSLRDDNAKLVWKVNELQQTVCELQELIRNSHKCLPTNALGTVVCEQNSKPNNNNKGAIKKVPKKLVSANAVIKSATSANSTAINAPAVPRETVQAPEIALSASHSLEQSISNTYATVSRTSKTGLLEDIVAVDAALSASAAVESQDALEGLANASVPASAALTPSHVFAPAALANEQRLHNWETVKLREPMKKKRVVVVGKSDNDDLRVFAKKKWVHLSSFLNSVSSEDIISFVSKHTGISGSNFECYKLVKKDHDVKDLKFVNFKLGFLPNFSEKIFDSSLWPVNIKVRPFRFLAKQSD